MRNEGADIIQNEAGEAQEQEWKTKAKVARDAAVDATRAAYHELQDKTVEYSRATDQRIRENPYTSLGVVFGVGFLLGLLCMRGRGKGEKD